MNAILPELSDLNRGFWEACAEGRLAVQRCRPCGHLRYPISEVCPRCLSLELEWEPLSGRGTLYSWIVFHHAYHPAWRDKLPYTVALVELAEGPMLISNLVAGEPALGMPLQVTFEQVGEFAIPRFVPNTQEEEQASDASR
jgi:uncharacterized OB-fold protein